MNELYDKMLSAIGLGSILVEVNANNVTLVEKTRKITAAPGGGFHLVDCATGFEELFPDVDTVVEYLKTGKKYF
jgi:hypothetical protein